MQNSAAHVFDASAPAYSAVKVWNRIMSCDRTPARLTTLKDQGETGVYRLHAIGPEGENVIAKRSLAGETEIERAVYQDVLSQLPQPALKCYGIGQDEESEYAWLFLEDAGDESYAANDPRQTAMLCKWLAVMHCCASRLPSAALLPDRGPAHYLNALASGSRKIRDCLSNPALQENDTETLDDILRRLASIGCRWKQVEDFCDGMPKTLVHGDFAGKNTRVRGSGADLTFYPLDWATAGWAVAAADLELDIDIELYWSFTREMWPRHHLDDWKQMALYGRIFRVLAGIEWAAVSLEYEWVSRPMSYMRAYDAYLEESIQAAGWEG
jgi:hypothetical protein